jgi:CheY-like chemotaxis protein
VVDSEAGKGSTFNVLLPPAGEHVDKGLVVEEQPAPVGSETILVAEDERSVRELVVKTLEGSGYTVVTAADGEEAVRKFREHDGVISLALLDAVMPRLGGREAMERITALDPSIKVLFSTGYASDGLHRRFTLDDSLEVIQKPYSVSALLERVREVLDRE